MPLRQKLLAVSVIATCTTAVCLRAIARQSSNDEQAIELAQKLANVQRNWGGPSMNSPDANLVLKETGRRDAGSFMAVSYRLVAKGLPAEKTYTLVTVSFDLKTAPVMQGVTLDGAGMAICAGRDGTCGNSAKPNDPIDLVIPAAKGEPKRFGLVSDDGESKAFAYAVPFPLRSENHGCSIESLLLLQNGEAVLLHGGGFPPGADVRYDTSSEGESHSANLRADESGNVWSVALPFVAGKSHGATKASFKSGSCNPSLTYQWGAGSYKLQ